MITVEKFNWNGMGLSHWNHVELVVGWSARVKVFWGEKEEEIKSESRRRSWMLLKCVGSLNEMLIN